MADARGFDPQRIIATLDRHRVDYILVGGYAAQLHGARRPTSDIDITPSRAQDNLGRLAEALKELDARIRVADPDEGLPFSSSAESLRGLRMLNLRTVAGDLDLTFAPAGFPDGYDDLAAGAHRRLVAGVMVAVAGLDDVIASKTAAGRAKDLDALPELLRIRARHRESGGDE